ncbi:MAG: Spy/CpxP family protein refolding chaperone [Candidatus Edwardsbacteria bacterium]
MSRKKLFPLLLTLVFFLARGGSIYAQLPGEGSIRGGPEMRGEGCEMPEDIGMPWWKDKAAAKEIGLSEEQVTKIKNMHLEQKKKMIGLRSELKVKEIELRKLFDEAKPNEAAIKAKAKEISDLREKMFLSDIELRLVMKKMLTPEQEEKIKAMRMKHKMPCPMH